ncbi:MAG: hypothetical protein A2Z20_09685 [Bdellovibrionales bacterium RBG_16_40_8]|nr:MAG: hypothetical protein A2Z20_09685 [Bdellovibrionales bacterium RBG_16_40_8]
MSKVSNMSKLGNKTGSIMTVMIGAFLAASTYAAEESTTTLAPTTSSASAASSVSAPISTVAPKAKTLTVSYVAENWLDATEADTQNYAPLSSQQHIGLAYDLGNSRKVQYRQYFLYNMTSANTQDELSLGDHLFLYTDSKIARIADLDMAFQARISIPGTEYGRKIGQYELRLSENITQKITGKFTMSYGLSTRIYGYSSNDDGQVALRFLPVVGASYAVNKVVTPFVNLYTDSRWNNRGVGIAVYGPRAGETRSRESKVSQANSFNSDIGSSIKFSKNIGLDAYMTTSKDLGSAASYNPFSAENNTYEIDLAVSL